MEIAFPPGPETNLQYVSLFPIELWFRAGPNGWTFGGLTPSS